MGLAVAVASGAAVVARRVEALGALEAACVAIPTPLCFGVAALVDALVEDEVASVEGAVSERSSRGGPAGRRTARGASVVLLLDSVEEVGRSGGAVCGSVGSYEAEAML